MDAHRSIYDSFHVVASRLNDSPPLGQHACIFRGCNRRGAARQRVRGLVQLEGVFVKKTTDNQKAMHVERMQERSKGGHNLAECSQQLQEPQASGNQGGMAGAEGYTSR